MKKRLVSLALLLLTLAFLALPALAAEERELPLVCDAYGLLTKEQDEELNALAEAYSQQYGCDIIVVTVGSTQGYDVESFTEAVYDSYRYGRGEDKSGVILLLSMNGRDYDLYTHGYGRTAFTDYGAEKLLGKVLPYLRKDDWAGAFRKYIELCAEYLQKARDGKPVDTILPAFLQGFRWSLKAVLWSLVAATVAAFMVTGILKSKMKSAVLQTEADDYLTGELDLTHREDRFLRKERVRTLRESSGGGGRGGGGGGGGHHSGKF